MMISVKTFMHQKQTLAKIKRPEKWHPPPLWECGKYQITCAHVRPRVQGNPGKHTNLGFFGGWADGRGVYWPRKRSSWIANALENFAARPSPSLCKIRKAASISSFEHESEKKGPPSPRPRQRSRPRLSDRSILQQPWFSMTIRSIR